MNKFICLLSILLVSAHACLAQTKGNPIVKNDVITGAERTEVYFPMLLGKKVAVFANHTSMVGKKHLVDTLLSSGIEVIKI